MMTASTTSKYAGAGPTLLRFAQDLVAKRAVDKYLRKRDRALERSRGCFGHLTCCVENEHLQHSLGRSEQMINRQGSELSNASRAREEEVKLLNMEVNRMQDELCRQGDDVFKDSSSDSACLRELRARLEEDVRRWKTEISDLQNQLLSQRAQIQAATQQGQEAQGKVASLQSKLVAQRETHERHISEMRRRLHANASDTTRHTQPTEDDMQLLRSCRELHAPAGRFLVRFDQQALPPLPASGADDVAREVDFVKALTASISHLYTQTFHDPTGAQASMAGAPRDGRAPRPRSTGP